MHHCLNSYIILQSLALCYFFISSRKLYQPVHFNHSQKKENELKNEKCLKRFVSQFEEVRTGERPNDYKIETVI